MIGWRSKPSTTEEDKPKGFDDFELRLGDLMRGERATLGKSLLDVQRELKIKAFHDFTFGHDTNALRIPRADAGQYSEAYRFQLFWMGTLGADDTFRRAATYSLLANIKLEDEGHFERKETLQ